MNYIDYLDDVKNMQMPERIIKLKKRILEEPRFMSIEQAKIITETYKENEDKPRVIQRAKALANALESIEIRIDPEELIVGNRTKEIRGGVVFPEAGIGWINDEIESFPTRPQDTFNVRPEDIRDFREIILPYWKDKGLRDEIEKVLGDDIKDLEMVAKINQKDHAQGHICPDTRKWLKLGPAGLKAEVIEKLQSAPHEKKDFYEALVIVLDASAKFMGRYGSLAVSMAEETENKEYENSLKEVSRICFKLAGCPPDTFHEALQSVWFLYVVLHMESNANSFSPGRMDQFLYPYFAADFERGRITIEQALELVEALWIKFNHIVYMRNSHSAKYFAGFTTGFNVAIGGKTVDGGDGTNLLSFLFLKAQDHVRLSQPNFSVRIYEGTPDCLLDECSRVIGLGSGMPQVFNDESIIPALENQGISHEDAVDYAIVGCVELTTHGNNLGWSDAAMFNLVKALELTINNGRCFLTGKKIGLETGYLYDYKSYEELEAAFKKQIDFFTDKMISACHVVDRMHAKVLPSPFLSTVISDCIENGLDVTAGGALYNYSGIQAIQVANIADSLAAIKKVIFEDELLAPEAMIEALSKNFEGHEVMRQQLLNKVPKYGNDIEWVDEIAHKWIRYFVDKVGNYTNARGGRCQVGLYTVSAHVPMGLNVGATPDGRKARMPLADGGMSAVYGRDKNGPTALLKSVSRIDSKLGSNGTLLNMKFLPEFFNSRSNIRKFSSFLKTLVKLRINHVQFNVLRKEDLLEAKKNPEAHRGLLVRVAGYTAYFTELAGDLQDEIIERTTYGNL